MSQRREIEILSEERRRARRADVVVRVHYATVDELFSEFSRNINEGGLFIETDSPAPLETRVQLQFELPGSPEPVKATGRVVRHADVQMGEPPGMAVEFEELDPDARERINQIVAQLRVQRS